MSSHFDVNTVVWVYMEGYPWWPGLVLDPAAATAALGEDIPAGKQAVMCLPSSAPSVVVVDPSNAAEVVPFHGADADAELVAAARASPDCAPAVEEALQFFAGGADSDAAQPNTATSPETTDADLVMLLDMNSHDDAEDKQRGEAEAAAEAARRQRKKEKKEKKERKRREREARGEHGSTRDSAVDDEDDDDDDDYLRSSSFAHKSGKKKHRSEKTIRERMDYGQKSAKAQRAEEGGGLMGAPRYSPGDDIEYYYRKLREGRERWTDDQLRASAERIKLAVAAVDANVMGDEAREAQLLAALRPLKSCDVTLEQLKTTSVGVVVGTLLKKRFPYAVQQLARAILLYWFRSLPASVQRKFTQINEIDRCSTDTTVGERSEDMNAALGALGVHIFESFTEEEIYDAPPGVDVIVVAKSIEEALASRDREERVMVLSMLGDASNTAIRRALLDGKLVAETLVDNAGDARSLMRNLGIRATAAGRLGTADLRIDTSLPASGTGPSLTSPTSGFFSPQGDDGNTFGSPTGRGSATAGGVTTLYACPNCGAREALRTVYTVSAHDNFPDILRCLRCDTTWNISDQ